MGMGMGPQKCKDFAYGIGPWITTADELPRPRAAVRLDPGQRRAVVLDARADGGIFPPAELVAWVSLGDNLQPGDLIGLGHPRQRIRPGDRPPLSPGDVLELQLDGVGVLRNRIGAREATRWWPEEKPYPFRAAEEVVA